MAPPSDRLDVITLAVFDAVVAKKTDLSLQDVWFGEQNKIPRCPAVCVIGDTKTREARGAPRLVTNTFRVRCDLYVVKVGDVQDLHADALSLADDLEEVLHEDLTFGGIVIGSLVGSSEQGVVDRSGTNYRTARLTLELENRSMLPMRPGYNQP
jgi:hypothetical protein